MSKNRMISNELMMALIKYHILDIKVMKKLIIL